MTYPARVFVRTCQECNHRIRANNPQGKPSDRYLNKACPKCGSEAFDYGSEQMVNADLSHANYDYTKDDN